MGKPMSKVVGSWVPVPRAVLLDPKLPLRLRGLYAVLMSYARPEQGKMVVWPSRETLAKACGLSASQISTMLAELERYGVIARKQRVGTTSETHFVDLADCYPTEKPEPSGKLAGGVTENHEGGYGKLDAEVDVGSRRTEAEEHGASAPPIDAPPKSNASRPPHGLSKPEFTDRVIYLWNTQVAERYGRPRHTIACKDIRRSVGARYGEEAWNDPAAVFEALHPLSDFYREGGPDGGFKGITLMTLVRNSSAAEKALGGHYRGDGGRSGGGGGGYELPLIRAERPERETGNGDGPIATVAEIAAAADRASASAGHRGGERGARLRAARRDDSSGGPDDDLL